jgi:cytidine deaminase
LHSRHLKLISDSIKALQYSYSPYSNFKVGAALLTDTDKIYTGANIECASYSLTLCAERVAFAKAISEGESKFKAIAIANNNNKFIFPCGACRQFMMEFSKDLKVILVKSQDVYKIYELKDLLPENFSLNK